MTAVIVTEDIIIWTVVKSQKLNRSNSNSMSINNKIEKSIVLLKKILLVTIIESSITKSTAKYLTQCHKRY